MKREPKRMETNPGSPNKAEKERSKRISSTDEGTAYNSSRNDGIKALKNMFTSKFF